LLAESVCAPLHGRPWATCGDTAILTSPAGQLTLQPRQRAGGVRLEAKTEGRLLHELQLGVVEDVV
jgi:hypothetical protein